MPGADFEGMRGAFRPTGDQTRGPRRRSGPDLTRGRRWAFVLVSLAAIAGGILALGHPWSAATARRQYYVNIHWGSDSNPGTSPLCPWQTLAPLKDHPLQPGDVVNLARGSSWDGGLEISESGAMGRPITFRAYGFGCRPIIRNPGRQWAKAITVNADWIVLQGLLVQDTHEYGIYIAKGADHNKVEDCEATQVGTGIGVFGDSNLITRNWVHDLTMILNTPGGDDDYGAVGIGLFSSGNEISHNRLERCRAPSYDYGTDGGAIEVYGDTTANYIHHNWAHENSGFIELGGGTIRDSVVAYNVALNNGTFAVVHLSGRHGGTVSRFCIDNNTIVEALRGDAILDFDGDLAPETLFLRNNILFVGRFRLVSDRSTIAHSNNLFYFAQPGTALGFELGSGERVADPQFVDLNKNDFHLRSGSPALRSGLKLHYEGGHPALPAAGEDTPNIGAF